MRTSTEPDRAVADVARWRSEQLVNSGFQPSVAAELAGDRRFDLHALIELVERGCSPELAVRILAPLDWRSAA